MASSKDGSPEELEQALEVFRMALHGRLEEASLEVPLQILTRDGVEFDSS